MQLPILVEWTHRRGTLVTVNGIPGLWRYSHPAELAGKKPPVVSEVWLDAEDRAAKRYVYSHSYGMLRVVTKRVIVVDTNQPKGNTNA